MRRAFLILASAPALALAPRTAFAVPGPDTTAIIANLDDPDSVALAEAYREARAIPRGQLCALSLPTGTDLSLDDFRTRLVQPFEDCLTTAGVLDRIEAVALMRGVPLRVAIPTASGPENASLAAALSVWKTTTLDGAPLLGQAPGVLVNCGGGQQCLGAAWFNAYRRGVFRPGWSGVDRQGTTHRPLLVTMLHGRSYEDAARLFTSALDGETKTPTVAGTYLFMDGADPARGALDGSYNAVIAGLADRGLTNAERVGFDPELRGRTLLAFFTGTAAIGATIEGNRFLPGAIVDNLTSFGAVPENFDPSGSEVQVSIARWVAEGVAGVHGTVDEPLNNCFPARDLLLGYVDGGTLAEVFFRAMPFVYWRNLVLGDPMAAPHAQRPRVRIEGVTEGETVAGARRLRVSVEDPGGHGIAGVRLYANGSLLAETGTTTIEGCQVLPIAGELELLAVAQSADDGTRGGAAQAKGWTRVVVHAVAGPSDCAEPDAGFAEDAAIASEDSGATLDAAPVRDAANMTDAGSVPVAPSPGGCSCSASEHGARGSLVPALILVLLRRRRRSPRPTARR